MHQRDADDGLDLSFADAWSLDGCPEYGAWAEPGELVEQVELAEQAESIELELELEQLEREQVAIPELPIDVSPRGWDLGGSGLGRVALAATLLPSLLVGAPAAAAPGEAAPVMQPSPSPDSPRSIWEVLVDQQVRISSIDGSVFEGKVHGLTDEGLVCSRRADGLVVVLDPASIRAVQVIDPRAPKPQTGQGMIVFGSIATSLGGALGLAMLTVGAICLDTYRDRYAGYVCPYMTLPLGVTSAVHLSVGIPLLVTGMRKRKQHRAAQASTPVITPLFGPSRGGAMAGVGIRF